MKIFSSWGNGKTSNKRKRTALKAKIRWDVIGLQDPGLMTTPSMEYIRSQILSMANQGLETHVRSNQKKGAHQASSNTTAAARKRPSNAA